MREGKASVWRQGAGPTCGLCERRASRRLETGTEFRFSCLARGVLIASSDLIQSLGDHVCAFEPDPGPDVAPGVPARWTSRNTRAAAAAPWRSAAARAACSLPVKSRRDSPADPSIPLTWRAPLPQRLGDPQELPTRSLKWRIFGVFTLPKALWQLLARTRALLHVLVVWKVPLLLFDAAHLAFVFLPFQNRCGDTARASTLS